MIELFNAGPRVGRVRFVMLLSMGCAFAGCWWGWSLFETVGSGIENDGRFWGIVVAALGVLFAVGMWAYGRRYIRTILFDPDRQMLHLRMLGMFGDKSFSLPAAQVERSTFSAGRLVNPMGVSVDAPWFSVRIRGRHWPLILDAQGHFLEEELLRRLLKA